ncbi:MAG TPA: tRNA pseudouridine(55) synthase TruB [Bacteroidia bacterium]|nr:tRNA pseudouridine(55) synthase TruB [Bacteroidia bacterium]
MDFQKGEIILINKPYKWTSFDVVNKIRYVLKKIPPADLSTLNLKPLPPREGSNVKVGHAGTLDPLATGLLIICTGKLTKEIDSYQAKEKEYTGTFFLGASTPSYDLETNVNRQFETSHIDDTLIFETVKKFKGKIFQTPPAHSAVKIDGQRAYKKARKGVDIKLEPKEIFIHEFEITKIELPLIHFRIVCSKGTYIRSVANDFGEALHSGAYLAALCRTRIGEFKLENAMTVEEFVEKFQMAKV